MTLKIFTVIAVLFASFAFTSVESSNNSEAFLLSNTTSENLISNNVTTNNLTLEEEIHLLYNVFEENNESVPNITSFKNAMVGYYKLAERDVVEKEILTIIDFNLSSTKKRMWVLDMVSNKVLYHTLVAHGKNTGNEYATEFSNTMNSLQSSLGFFVTGETYFGGNGYSMFIDGMEEKFNSNARERYVVVHGAAYANPESIKNLGRLGRSYGCPALPTAVTKEIIDVIKNKSVLYIHSSNKNYNENSKMIKV